MAFRSISVNATQAATSIVTPPAGIQNNDVLIDFAASDNSATNFTHPTSFDPVTGTPITCTRDGQRSAAAIKVAASETGNYSIGATDGICGGVLALSGRTPSTTPHRSSVANSNALNASPWSITSAAFGTPTTEVCDIVLLVFSDVGAGLDVNHDPASSGLTERADLVDSVSAFINLAVYTADDVPAGATGVYTVTGAAGSTSGWSAICLAIASGKSAAVSGTGASGTTEADIRAGGKTIVITLTGDTFIPN